MKKENFNELVNQARETNLLDYFQTSAYTVKKENENYYVNEYPGLCIKPETNQWYYHYTNEGRTNNSIDCLTIVLGRSFNQAVYELTGKDVSNERSNNYPKSHMPQYTSPKHTLPEKEKIILKMPKPAPNMRRLFAYLCQVRKIPAVIIEELVHAKLLYQSQDEIKTKVNGVDQKVNNSNAVFIHKNENGEIIGGEIQGINSFKRYKGIAAGTGNSAFMFTPISSKDNQLKRAYIFESAIDLMSFYSFCDKKKLCGAVLVSLAGLKPTVPKELEEKGIQIISCVDNDDAGRKFEEENHFIRSESVKEHLDKKGFKDWNELLVFKGENPNANLLSESKAENKNIIDTISRRK